jgi:hypothetical protein
MLNIVYIILYSVLINWMISLSILFQVSESKNIRLRSGILLLISGIISGYVIYLL